VCCYIDFAHQNTCVHGNSAKLAVSKLSGKVPLLSPHFILVPPSLFTKGEGLPSKAHVEHYYVKPIHIVHPFFYPTLTKISCPGCWKFGTEPSIQWTQWAGKGPRDVHGLMEEEYAIGYQMQCKTCTAGTQQDKQLQGLKEVIEVDDNGDDDDDPDMSDQIMKPQSHFWATTNREYWSGVLHWQVPCACRTFVACSSARLLTHRFSSMDPVGIPHFLKKCALSRDLFDIIIEMHPSVPSATLQNHIRCMSVHLLHQLLSPPSHNMTELHLVTYEH